MVASFGGWNYTEVQPLHTKSVVVLRKIIGGIVIEVAVATLGGCTRLRVSHTWNEGCLIKGLTPAHVR